MESVSNYKGYGKVAPLDMEGQQHQLPLQKPQPPCCKPKRSSTLAISALLIALVLGISLAVVFGVSRSPPPSQPRFADSIRLVCNVTRYPDSCLASISSLDASPNPDPELILKLSIRVCLEQAIASLNISASEECDELYEDARSRISDAMEAMGGNGRVGLTEDRVNDVQTWLSAALTDQETCLDGLEESAKLEAFKVNAQKLKEYLSNSLAIVANIHPLLHKFGLELH